MPTYAVIGASGSVGSKVVNELAKIASSTVRAIVRDPESTKSKAIVVSPNVSLVTGNMAVSESLDAGLAGVDAVFINTAGSVDRALLVKNALLAVKRSGAKHVVVVSFSNAGAMTEIFGRQGAEIEAEVTAPGGTPFTILRLPLFFDNFWGNAGSIKGQSKIYNSASPDGGSVGISTDDIAAVAAAIIEQGPGKHGGKTYYINGEPYTNAALAAAFSSALGRTVDYVQVPESGVEQAMSGFGMQKWQIDGILDLNRRITAGTYAFPSDVEAILGRPATTMEAFVKAIAGSGAF